MFDAALDHTAHAVLAVVRNEASELTETSEGVGFELAVIDNSDQNDIVYQVRGPNGVMVYRSHGAPLKPLAGPHDRGFSVAHIDGQDFRVFSLATELDAATIHVAQPMARRIKLMHASVARLLVPGVRVDDHACAGRRMDGSQGDPSAGALCGGPGRSGGGDG